MIRPIPDPAGRVLHTKLMREMVEKINEIVAVMNARLGWDDDLAAEVEADILRAFASPFRIWPEED